MIISESQCSEIDLTFALCPFTFALHLPFCRKNIALNTKISCN